LQLIRFMMFLKSALKRYAMDENMAKYRLYYEFFGPQYSTFKAFLTKRVNNACIIFYRYFIIQTLYDIVVHISRLAKFQCLIPIFHVIPL
jgi:hypothetical protein